MKWVVTLLAFVTVGCSTGLNEKQTRDWMRHVIPLPQQAAIERAAWVDPAAVVVRTRANADEVELAMATRLREKLATLAGKPPQTQPAAAKFEILVGICDWTGKLDSVALYGAAALKKLPNSEQAYLIAPDGDKRLVLTALSDKGIVYAAQTYCQLLDGSRVDVGCMSDGPEMNLPVPRILDWPDMEERGLWGPHSVDQVKWLAQSKLNLVENSVENSITATPDGRGHYKPPPPCNDSTFGYNTSWNRELRFAAVKLIPFIPHMNGMFGFTQPRELYKSHPELRGMRFSDKTHKLEPTLEIPCFNQPMIRQLLVDWMTEVAAYEGGSELCIWLSEDLMGLECECPECKKLGHYVMETRAFVAAWRETRKKYPGLRLRILLTQGSNPTNDKVLAEIPPEVGVTDYMAGEGTYQVSKSPMIPPLLDKYAASGRWLGVYPTIEPCYDIPWPWTSPTFMQSRMSEFVDKGLRNCSSFQPGYSALFALTAQGEWLWNAHGRTPRELAAAFATRNKLRDVEAFADWAMLVSDPGWDVHGYGMWFQGFFEELARLVRDRRPARLGEGKLCQGIYRYFPTAQHIDDDLAACDKAMTIATKSLADYPEAAIETRCTAGLLHLLKDAYEMSTVVSRPSMPGEADYLRLQRLMKQYSLHSLELQQAYHDYLAHKKRRQQAFVNIDDMIAKAALDIAKALAPFGVRDAYGPCWPAKVGEWDNKLVEGRGKPLRKNWEVTAQIAGPGQYTVRFGGNQTSRELLNINRVALAWAPKSNPAQLTELSEDKHFGRTWACWSENEVYTLKLDSVDADKLYFIVTDIAAGGSAYGPQDTMPMACGGNVLFCKALPANAAMPDLPLQTPDPALKFYYEGPAFAPGKLAVGVIQGCYGSDEILARLRAAPGVDAQPIYFLPHHFDKCQVVVYPQPCCVISLEQGGAWVQQYMNRGGGVVVTHDGVGYRGLPPLAPEVCAKGVVHAADVGWKIEGKHPVIDGFAPGAILTRAYYDIISLQAGPKGTVVARGSPSNAPVVICGPCGKGRFVACGLCLGFGPGEKSAPLTPDEGKLLENAVRWAARENK